jgi:hypothetical protein
LCCNAVVNHSTYIDIFKNTRCSFSDTEVQTQWVARKHVKAVNLVSALNHINAYQLLSTAEKCGKLGRIPQSVVKIWYFCETMRISASDVGLKSCLKMAVKMIFVLHNTQDINIVT